MRLRVGAALAAGLLLAAAAVFVARFDADSLKPRIVAAVAAATGRELTLGGHLHLALAPTPRLEVTDVALANAPGGSEAAMATVRRLRLRLALLPLLRGQVVIDSLALEQPQVLLETDAAGHPNWQFRRPEPSGDAAGPAPQRTRRPMAIRRVEITDGSIQWRDGRTGQSGSLSVPQLALTQADPQAPVLLHGRVLAGGLSAQIEARTGLPPAQAHFELHGTLAGQPVSLIADRGTAPEIAITAQAGGARFTLAGGVALPGLNVRVTAQVPDPAALAALTGRTFALAGPLGFSGQVTGDAKGALALQGFTLNLPAGDVSGDLTLTCGAVPSLRGQLTAQRFDLDRLRVAAADHGGPPPPAPPVSRMLIPDTPLPLSGLRAIDADLQLAAATLVRGGTTVTGFATHVLLSGGRLSLDPITAQSPGGALQASLTVDASAPSPAPAPVALRLRAPGLAVAAVLTALHLPPLFTGALDVSADLHSAGRTPRALAAGLDGSVGLAMQGGEIDDTALRPVLAALLRSARLPAEVIAASGDTALRCLALRVTFAGGRGAVRPLLLDAPRFHVEGEGTVNLQDETLLLELRPLVRLGTAGIAVPLRVSGPLAAPRGQLDTGAVAGALAGGSGFRAIIGALDEAAATETCGPALAMVHGAAAPAADPPVAKPPKVIDLLKQLLR